MSLDITQRMHETRLFGWQTIAKDQERVKF